MNDNNSSVWKSVLSVVFAIFMVIKLLYTCSKINNRNNYSSYESQNYINNSLANYQNEMQNAIAANANGFLYKDYAELDTINPKIKELYSVRKLDKDTIINLDLSNKISIKKNCYFQKNNDDSLRYGIKLTDGNTIFIHDFEGQGDLIENLKAIKGKTCSEAKFSDSNKELQTIEYQFSVNDKKINGFAIASKQDSYFSFVEYESDKIRKKDLKEKALFYFMNNIK